MSQFEIYMFILCIIVFALLTGLSIFVITYITKQYTKLVRHGVEDEAIIKEYEIESKKKKSNVLGIIENMISIVLFVVIVGCFGFSLYVSIQQDTYYENVPTLRVVNTGSMSYKHEDNKYLFNNDLNDQFDAFDVILTYQLPKEEDLKLYDIVVYELNNILIVHRIIGIEEPNELHPEERYFLLQGDANDSPDKFPVLYEQMKGIYRGESIPFVGSLILFLQSPAGWMCILLIVGTMIGTPFLEKYYADEKRKRLIAIGYFDKKDTSVDDDSSNDDTNNDSNDTEEVDTNITNSFDFETKTFEEKLELSSDTVKEYYNSIHDALASIEGININRSKKYETYRYKNKPIARLIIKGKTLNVYLALECEKYLDTKYIFNDVSNVKAYQNYPMRTKLTSDRKLKWTFELLIDKFKEFGIDLIIPVKVVENVVDDSNDTDGVIENNNLDFNKFNFETKTFEEKLELSSDTVKEYYNSIHNGLSSIAGININRSKKYETYRYKNKPIARLVIRGKTLNVYLALDINKYVDTKYIFEDASNVKAYSKYPMRMRISSSRKVKWVKELLIVKFKEFSLEVSFENKVNNDNNSFSFNFKTRTFKQKLSIADSSLKEEYKDLNKLLLSYDGVRLIESKRFMTYKLKSLPLVKMQIRGKTLNVYLALNIEEYKDSKYIFKDVSNVKAFEKYPMRMKISSPRQLRWVKELIEEMILNNQVKEKVYE